MAQQAAPEQLRAAQAVFFVPKWQLLFFIFHYALSKHLEGPVKAQWVIFPPPHIFVLSYLNFENKEV